MVAALQGQAVCGGAMDRAGAKGYWAPTPKGFSQCQRQSEGEGGRWRLSNDAKSVGISSRNKEETSKRATRCKMDTSTYILFIYMKIKSRVEIYNTRHVQTYRPSRARRVYYKLAQSDVAVQQTKTACMHMRCKHYTHN